jgi:hypothetical protein
MGKFVVNIKHVSQADMTYHAVDAIFSVWPGGWPLCNLKGV